MTRNQQILELCGQKSYGLIAEQLDITRNVVAGVIFRAAHPVELRYSSPNGTRNKLGTGQQGPGPYADQTLLHAPRARIPLAQSPQATGTAPTEAIELIQFVCARGFGISARVLCGCSCKQRIVHARHVAMALARELTVYSLPEIGRRFGGRDHTTVWYAVDKIETMLAADETLRLEMDLLRATIAGAEA